VKVGIEGARKKLSSCLAEVEFYRRQLEAVESRMVELLEKLPEAKRLMSIPGVGPVVAATVLGEVGDFRRFKNWKQLRKLSGYNLVAQSSGQKKEQSAISNRGRLGLRYILYLAAVVAVTKNQEFPGPIRVADHTAAQSSQREAGAGCGGHQDTADHVRAGEVWAQLLSGRTDESVPTGGCQGGLLVHEAPDSSITRGIPSRSH
jgi:hypothetical protein